MTPGRLGERLLAMDPDLSRLRLAARATLTAILSAALLHLLSRWLPLSVGALLLGAALPMLANLALTEPDPRAQQATLWLSLLPASLGLVTGTLAAPHRLASVVLFILAAAASILAQRFGARGTALGLMGFNAYFFAILFPMRAVELAGPLGALVLGTGVAFGVRFHLVPERPRPMLRRSLHAQRALVSRVLGTLAAHVRSESRLRGARVRASLRMLNEGALTLEDLLARAPEDALPAGRATLRSRVLGLELAAGRVVADTVDVLREAGGQERLRPLLARALELARLAARGDAGAAASSRTLLETAAGECMGSNHAAFTLSRLSAALGELLDGVDLERARRPHEPVLPGTATLPALERVPSSGRLHPSTRQAVQVALASAAAMGAGRLISPERWSWAVLAAYLVVARASTRGEIIARAWDRTLGTVAGVFPGILLAAALRGHPRLELFLLFVFVFLAFYSMRGSYTLMVLWLTASLASLFSLFGLYTPQLLYVRVAETVAGAAIGALTATFILPSRTGGQVRLLLGRVLGGVADNLAHIAQADPRGNPALLERARVLDQALRELRAAAQPLTRSRMQPARETIELVHQVSLVVFYLRQLATPGLLEAALQASPRLAGAAERLSHSALVLKQALAGEARAPPAAVAPLLHEAGGLPAPEALALCAHWLRRIDDVMGQMARGLRLPAAAGDTGAT